MTVNYSGVGLVRRPPASSRSGTVDFAVSRDPVPARPTATVVDPRPTREFAYMPIVAGGTSFMYNLKIGGKRVTNLRLSRRDDREDLHRRRSRSGTTRRSRPTTRGLALPADRDRAGRALRRLGHDGPVHRLDAASSTRRSGTPTARRPGAAPLRHHLELPDRPGNGFIGADAARTASRATWRRSSTSGRDHLRRVLLRPQLAASRSRRCSTAPATTSSRPRRTSRSALLGARINDDAASPDYLTQNLDGVYTQRRPAHLPAVVATRT